MHLKKHELLKTGTVQKQDMIVINYKEVVMHRISTFNVDAYKAAVSFLQGDKS